MKILIVDGDHYVRKFLKDYLKDRGHEFQVAPWPNRLRGELDIVDYDIALIDGSCADGRGMYSGFDLLADLQMAYPDRPVYCISGLDPLTCPCGGRVHLGKPVKLDGLERLLNKANPKKRENGDKR